VQTSRAVILIDSEPPAIASLLMPNYDARMTGEVDKRFQGQRRNWSVLPKTWSLVAALVASFAICSGTAPHLPAAPQQNAPDSNLERVSRPANHHSKAGARNAQRWKVAAQRLNGIPETDRWVLSLSLKMVENRFFLQTVREVKRSLRGSENVGYVFELYGDDQRQTLPC
jgi:hypothetical protein